MDCFVDTIFGIKCLGCGATTSLLLLMKGELVAAFQAYPPIFLVLTSLLSYVAVLLDKLQLKWLIASVVAAILCIGLNFLHINGWL